MAVDTSVLSRDLILDELAHSSSISLRFRFRRRLNLWSPEDQHYRLFVQCGYKREAQSIATPELVSQLIAAPVAIDVEIVGGQGQVEPPGRHATLNPSRCTRGAHESTSRASTTAPEGECPWAP